MDKAKLEQLLRDVRSGDLEIADAVNNLSQLPYSDLGFAKVDTHRAIRRGFAETIFCLGKTTEQIKQIAAAFPKDASPILATRATPEVYEAIREVREDAQYFDTAQIVLIGEPNEPKTDRKIAIVTAGTSDIPVAEEAAITAYAMGNHIERIYDAGVAGIHRLLHNKDLLYSASVVVVVAGMDGALPSIIGGLIARPIIAVPTSVGYGASFNGIAALLTMLNSCSPGVSVVNIDNGFGAGYCAAVINKVEE